MKNVIPATNFADRLYDRRKNDIIVAVKKLLTLFISGEDLKAGRETTTFLNLVAFICDHEGFVPKGWLQHLTPNITFNEGPDDDAPYSMPGTVFELASSLSTLFLETLEKKAFITITCLPDQVDVLGSSIEDLDKVRDDYLDRSGDASWSFYIFYEKLWHYLRLYCSFHIDESTPDRVVFTAKNPALLGAIKIEMDLTMAKQDTDRMNAVLGDK